MRDIQKLRSIFEDVRDDSHKYIMDNFRISNVTQAKPDGVESPNYLLVTFPGFKVQFIQTRKNPASQDTSFHEALFITPIAIGIEGINPTLVVYWAKEVASYIKDQYLQGSDQEVIVEELITQQYPDA